MIFFTGYTREEILGRNCRFLQGPGQFEFVLYAGFAEHLRYSHAPGPLRFRPPSFCMSVLAVTMAPVGTTWAASVSSRGFAEAGTVYTREEGAARRLSFGLVRSCSRQGRRPLRRQMKAFLARYKLGLVVGGCRRRRRRRALEGRWWASCGSAWPHHLHVPNWVALKARVDKHEAEGKVGRLSPDDFVPLKRLGNGDVAAASASAAQRPRSNRLFAMKILARRSARRRTACARSGRRVRFWRRWITPSSSALEDAFRP